LELLCLQDMQQGVQALCGRIEAQDFGHRADMSALRCVLDEIRISHKSLQAEQGKMLAEMHNSLPPRELSITALPSKMKDFEFHFEVLATRIETLAVEMEEKNRALTEGKAHVQELQLHVLGAKGLPNTEWFGKASPYCVCHFEEVPTGQTRQSKVQTKVISKNLNPEWNEMFAILDYIPGDNIVFSVYDSQPAGKTEQLLGMGTLRYTSLQSGTFEGNVAMRKPGEKTRSSLLRVCVNTDAKQSVVPQLLNDKGVSEAQVDALSADITDQTGNWAENIVQLHTQFDQEIKQLYSTILSGRVCVYVFGARELRNMVWNTVSSHFCTCEIVGRSESLTQTKAATSYANPLWEEELQISGYEPGDDILFIVYDRAIGEIGRVQLDASQLTVGFDGELQMNDPQDQKQGHLRIRANLELSHRKGRCVDSSELKAQVLHDKIDTLSASFAKILDVAYEPDEDLPLQQLVQECPEPELEGQLCGMGRLTRLRSTS